MAVIYEGNRDLTRLWYPLPLFVKILNVLQKRQGSVTDIELYTEIKKEYTAIGFSTFNKTLMKLEVQGLIHVFHLTKNKRGVELVAS